MKKVLIAPRKYVQGPDVLKEAGTYLALLGKKPLVLWDTIVEGLIGEMVRKSIEEAGLEIVSVTFAGDSTQKEAARVAEIAKTEGADVVVGAGGGKTLDTAKGAAVEVGLPFVTVPTIASNDSPTSAASVWYDDEGKFIRWDCWPFNPDIVLVDSRVIANGPVRAFVAGMGDALATWLEAEAAYKTRSTALSGGVATLSAMAIARLCYETLLEYGVEARLAVEHDALTPAVEKVIEANVLMSGIGFESGGLASAHMVANALPSLFQNCHLMHGEEVGFGIVSQLCLDEDVDVDEMHAIVDFEIAVGLPVTFADLGLEDVTREQLRPIGDVCAGEGSLCANHPFKITAEDVIDAMIAADTLGQRRKDRAGF